MKSYLTHFWQSKSHAWRGLTYTFQHEPNFRIQLLFGVLVIVAMIIFRIPEIQSFILILLILAVLLLELLNTAIESLADVLKPRLHMHVKVAKDIAAGMVFLASVSAAVIGTIIFYPYIASLIASFVL